MYLASRAVTSAIVSSHRIPQQLSLHFKTGTITLLAALCLLMKHYTVILASMEPPMAAHLDRRPPASVAPDLPEDVCDLIIDIIMESLLKSRRRRTFAFAGWEDMELHREELRCRTTLAAGARVSKAWHSPFQYRLTQP